MDASRAMSKMSAENEISRKNLAKLAKFVESTNARVDFHGDVLEQCKFKFGELEEDGRLLRDAVVTHLEEIEDKVTECERNVDKTKIVLKEDIKLARQAAEGLSSRLEERVERSEKKLEKDFMEMWEDVIEDLEGKVEEKFDQTKEKVEHLNERLTCLEECVEDKLGQVDRGINRAHSRIDDLEREVQDHHAETSAALSVIETAVKAGQQDAAVQVSELEQKVIKLEKYMKRAAIEAEEDKYTDQAVRREIMFCDRLKTDSSIRKLEHMLEGQISRNDALTNQMARMQEEIDALKAQRTVKPEETATENARQVAAIEALDTGNLQTAAMLEEWEIEDGEESPDTFE